MSSNKVKSTNSCNSIEALISNLQVVYWISLLVVSVACSRRADKRQLSAWRVECELGLVADPACPVDGGWGAWGAWSACRGPCDDLGHRRRVRLCVNPPPSSDGLPCSGADEEIELCHHTNCTVDHFRILVESDSVRTQALHQLETVPALMGRCLQKECGYESIEAALTSDNTWQIDPEAFWNSLQCVKHNLGCRVSGEWGGWSAWSACGARCGRGRRWRLRRCDTPPPSSAHAPCAGSPLQAEDCEGEQCAPDAAAGRGALWAPWEPWSLCSERCASGVRRRRRTCLEKPVTRLAGRWETSCIGRYEEYEVCENSICYLNGGWSGWSNWGPCSQTCGAGKRFRSRSCTRPEPSGGGQNCVGSKTEFGTCYLNPCSAYTHVVAILNGDSYLHYNFKNKLSSLFHLYIRFLPLSPHGTLVRRGPARDPLVRLSVHRWHACLDARGSSSCLAPRVCSPAPLEPAVWHSALLTVSNEAATLRLNDALVPIKAIFLCDPDLPYLQMNVLIGERFHGEIQEIILNFIPLRLIAEPEPRSSLKDFSPTSAANVVYERASIDEAYLYLHDGQYLRIPCFNSQDEWRLELTIKPKADSGTILFMKDSLGHSWFHMGLQNMRLKMKLAKGDIRVESSSTTECPPEQWLDVMVIKKKEANAIEASLNAGERLHIVLEDEMLRKRRELRKRLIALLSVNTKQKIESRRHTKPVLLTVCNDEFYVGGTPPEISQYLRDDLTPFSGVIATININNVMQDLHSFSVEHNKRDQVQLSSRTASVSGSYHETAWGSSNRLSLTCLHARTARSPHGAQWLLLDTTITSAVKQKTVRALDDGKVLKLVATADNDLRGFYTCRAHTNKRTVNVVTYGVTGKIKYNLSQPDTTTALAVLTTVLLVVATLGWLIVEGIYDLRTGFGFFRDAHLTPEQEAEAVCSYIEDHAHLIGSPNAVNLAKARARYRAKLQTVDSTSSIAAQETESLVQMIEQLSVVSDAEYSILKDLELPGLPGKPNTTKSEKSSYKATLAKHEVYRCEPNYVSSPRHGSLTSLRTRLTSSSSMNLSSPRFLCSRLLLARKIHTSRPSLWAKKHRIACNRHFVVARKTSGKLATIKSSTFASKIALSTAQQILQKFQQLRCDD